MAQQPPKFSLYNAGLQDKIFAVNEDHPSPPRPSSARSRVSTKSVPTKRPGSASHIRSRGTNLKPQSSDNRRPAQPLQPVPPGHSRKKNADVHGHANKKEPGVDMRAFQVLGREELLGQLIIVKKKLAASDSSLHQLRAENQRLESEVSKQQHRIDKILSPQYSKSSHLVLEIRKEIEKSVLVRQLKAQMTSLRATIAEKDAQIEAMHNNVSSSTLLELTAEKEEYMVEIERLTKIIAQKDDALEGARRQAQWTQQERQDSAHETGDNLRHELDRLTRGYEEVLHRLEVKNAASGASAAHNSDAASVKSGSSRKSVRGRPKSSSSARSSRGKASKGGGGSSSNNAPPVAEKAVPKVSSLNELDPELTTFAQQYDSQPREEPAAMNTVNSLTNINKEERVTTPANDGYDFHDYENNMLTESVDDIPNGGKMQIIADAMDGNLSQVIGGLPLGCKVTANYNGEGTHYAGTVVKQHDDNRYDIEYDDGDRETRVTRENIVVLGEPRKKEAEQSQSPGKGARVEEQQSECFDLKEGARVDLIVNEQDDAMQTGTVVAVLRDGRAFDVEMDSGDVLNNVAGHLLHKSLELADQFHDIAEKQNLAKFAVGDKVEALYRGKTRWYPGVISKVRAEGFDVDYDDGEKEYNVKEELIREAPKAEPEVKPENTQSVRKSVLRKFRIGQRVEGNYRGQGKWYPGEIGKVRTEGFDIDYDDGEKEYNVKDELIRAEPISMPGAGSGATKKVSAEQEQTTSKVKFAVGDKVEALYRGKTRWYPGVISKVRAEGFDVDYDDGEKEYNVKEELIRPLGATTQEEPPQQEAVVLAKFVVGDKVEALYRGKTRWYPGVISKVRAEGFDVDYDDGEKEYNVKEELIRPQGGQNFDNTSETFRTTVESTSSARAGGGGGGKPKQQLATNDDLNDFLNNLGSDDESDLPDYGGGGGLLTEEEQGGYDYGNDFED